jgi:hypothetical protein
MTTEYSPRNTTHEVETAVFSIGATGPYGGTARRRGRPPARSAPPGRRRRVLLSRPASSRSTATRPRSSGRPHRSSRASCSSLHSTSHFDRALTATTGIRAAPQTSRSSEARTAHVSRLRAPPPSPHVVAPDEAASASASAAAQCCVRVTASVSHIRLKTPATGRSRVAGGCDAPVTRLDDQRERRPRVLLLDESGTDGALLPLPRSSSERGRYPLPEAVA